MTNTCIRVLADEHQIKQCKEDINLAEDTIVRLAKALSLAGNEVRLKILFLLNKETKMCPCDLSDILNMSVPAVSQHLRKLKDAGLVSTERVGQTIFYTITEEHSYILDPLFKILSPKHREDVAEGSIQPLKNN